MSTLRNLVVLFLLVLPAIASAQSSAFERCTSLVSDFSTEANFLSAPIDLNFQGEWIKIGYFPYTSTGLIYDGLKSIVIESTQEKYLNLKYIETVVKNQRNEPKDVEVEFFLKDNFILEDTVRGINLDYLPEIDLSLNEAMSIQKNKCKLDVYGEFLICQEKISYYTEGVATSSHNEFRCFRKKPLI